MKLQRSVGHDVHAMLSQLQVYAAETLQKLLRHAPNIVPELHKTAVAIGLET